MEAKDIPTSALEMGAGLLREKIPHLLGYDVSQTVAITLKGLTKYEVLTTQLLEAGVNRVNGVSFPIGQSRKDKDEARSKAISAAKEKAMVMAAELGETVGKPWEYRKKEMAFTPALSPGLTRITRTAPAPGRRKNLR